MPDCSDIRKQWDDAFDAERAPALKVTLHLSECDDCRTYASASIGLRESLRSLPLGSESDAADQAILAALRAHRAPMVPTRRPVLPLVFAGAGSFALTLVVAGVMLSAASGMPEAPVNGVARQGIARTPAPETNAELDAWLEGPGLITGSRSLRPVAAPAPPKRSPLRGQGIPPRRIA